MDKVTLDALSDRARELSLKLSDDEKRARCLAMLDTLQLNPNWPDLKIGGWLEHIITVCIENGVTSIEAERDFSRPIKHAYYRSLGIDIPKTIDVLEPSISDSSKTPESRQNSKVGTEEEQLDLFHSAR